MNTKANHSFLAREIMRKSRYVLCKFRLETFCLTQTCYDVDELLFKGEDEGLPQMDCEVNSGMYRAQVPLGVWFSIECRLLANCD